MLSVPAWKWTLTALEDEKLSAIAKTLKVRVPGFRGSNWEKQLPLLRPQIVQNLLSSKMFLGLGPAIDAIVQESELAEIRELTERRIDGAGPDKWAPPQVFLSLLSSPEAEAVELATCLYDQWEESGLLEQWLSAREQADADSEQESSKQVALDECQEKIAELEAQIKSLEKRRKKLAEAVAKEKAGLARAQRKWKNEREQLTKQLAEREAAVRERDEQLAQQAEIIEEQKKEIAQLQQRLAEGDVLLAQQQTDVADTTVSSLPPEETLPYTWEVLPQPKQVAVVGNLQPINMPPTECGGYYLVHIAPKELQSEQVAARLSDVDQVWLLTYATPLPLQRRLRQMVATDRLVCFSTYEEFMHNLGQGV